MSAASASGSTSTRRAFCRTRCRWRFRVTESDPPTGFRLEAEGDFVGRGIWTLRQVAGPDAPGGPLTTVTYDWLIVAEKGLLRRLSAVMKPIFAANHRWCMARGEESLKIELARRHAASDPTIADAIPRPPGPTFPHNLRAPAATDATRSLGSSRRAGHARERHCTLVRDRGRRQLGEAAAVDADAPLDSAGASEAPAAGIASSAAAAIDFVGCLDVEHVIALDVPVAVDALAPEVAFLYRLPAERRVGDLQVRVIDPPALDHRRQELRGSHPVGAEDAHEEVE